ncbi:MAG: hypothetical protein U0838_02625 [Chloroflexota bacterium]
MQQSADTKPNGPVAAAFLAGGIGSLALGVLVCLNELGGDISKFLAFDKNFGLGSGVGPLSGKAIIAVLAFVISWVILHFAFRGKEVAFGRVFTIALVLVAAGFLLTFPPVFDLFAPKGG